MTPGLDRLRRGLEGSPGTARANGAAGSTTEAAPSGAADTTAKEGVS